MRVQPRYRIVIEQRLWELLKKREAERARAAFDLGLHGLLVLESVYVILVLGVSRFGNVYACVGSFIRGCSFVP